MTPKPPIARVVPTRTEHHGNTRVDNYAWLRAENWQDVVRDPSRLDPEIRAYLDAENAYADAMMADTAALQEELFAEMVGRLRPDDASVPVPDGPYAYSIRFVRDAQHPMIVRSRRDGGEETILLDASGMAEGTPYFRLGTTAHSPDHRRLAYATDEVGAEFFQLRIRDIASGTDLDEVITGTSGSAAWAADSRSLFYIRLDANHRPARVHRHVVGTDPASDELVYEEPDPGFFLSVRLTHSRRYLLIQSYDHDTSEVRFIDAEVPDSPPRLIAERRTGEKYAVEHHGDSFLILTNRGEAEDFMIVTAPVAAPGRAGWRPLVPHRAGRLILAHTAFRDFLVRLEREDGLPRIVVREMASGEEHAIAFAEEAYSLSILDGPEYDRPTLRFGYSSPATPNRVYDYDMASRARVLRKAEEIPSGHDPDDYVVRLVHAPAEDGEEVPITLLYRHDLPLDGSAPAMLFGYGAYGVTTPNAFSIGRLSLVSRGWIYAIAHIRGSQAKGYRWYREGRRERKVNTFTDFIAAARHLAGGTFTRPGRIVGWGASAGGLLIGAVANMAPELFGGLIADVPFVDVLTTMLDDSLPLTPPEWPEWGNPILSAEDYQTIMAYSPYDNVRAQAYPPILVIAGLADPRVTYWEPAKWVAKLRATRTNDALLLLKTNMEAGHGGPSGRFEAFRETALISAFAMKVVGQAA